MQFERIHIELTNRCNFSCRFCPHSLMTRPPGDLPPDLWKRALDEIAEARLTKNISFHLMGEPLLSPDLVDATRYARERGLTVGITTNGWLCRGDLLESLLEAEADTIFISAQTPDAESFGLRTTKVDFEEYRRRITSAIARIIETEKTEAILSFLLTPLSAIFASNNRMEIIGNKRALLRHFTDWFELILEAGGDSKIFTRLGRSRKVIEQSIRRFFIFGWNRQRITSNFSFETRVLGDWAHPNLSARKPRRARIGSCEGLFNHIGILSNGDLVFCCSDYDGKTAFGNLRESSILDALRSETFVTARAGFSRRRVLHPYCRRCLGDTNIVKSVAKQSGSVFYFELYRKYWRKKRGLVKPLIGNPSRGMVCPSDRKGSL